MHPRPGSAAVAPLGSGAAAAAAVAARTNTEEKRSVGNEVVQRRDGTNKEAPWKKKRPRLNRRPSHQKCCIPVGKYSVPFVEVVDACMWYNDLHLVRIIPRRC